MQTQKESENIKVCELITLQIEFQTTEIYPGNMMEVWKKCAQECFGLWSVRMKDC